MGARPILKGVDHQEAVEVDREVTNGREPSATTGCNRQLSESAGHNASERRAGLENFGCGSRPSRPKRGRPRRLGRATCPIGSAGVVTMARDKGNNHATREIRRGVPGRIVVAVVAELTLYGFWPVDGCLPNSLRILEHGLTSGVSRFLHCSDLAGQSDCRSARARRGWAIRVALRNQLDRRDGASLAAIGIDRASVRGSRPPCGSRSRAASAGRCCSGSSGKRSNGRGCCAG